MALPGIVQFHHSDPADESRNPQACLAVGVALVAAPAVLVQCRKEITRCFAC
jgi:hypothetical protein